MKEVRYFYVPQASLTDMLPDDEALHAIRVLRLHEQDEIVLMDGDGIFYDAVITSTKAKHCKYEIVRSMPQNKTWKGHLHLAIAPTKMMDRMERVTLAGFASAQGGKNPSGKENADGKQEESKKENKKEYYVPSMGNVPFTLDQIRSFVQAGLVKPDTIIRINGQDWQAGTLTELADLFAK